MLLQQAIEDFITGYFSTHERSPKTRSAYRSDLDQLGAYANTNQMLASLDAAFIERWAADLRLRNYSPASMRRKMVVLKVFYSYWVRKGVISESPFWRVRLSLGRVTQLPRALTEGEIRELLTQAKTASTVLRKGSVLARGKSGRNSLLEYRAARNLALVDLLFAPLACRLPLVRGMFRSSLGCYCLTISCRKAPFNPERHWSHPGPRSHLADRFCLSKSAEVHRAR